jgi:hypothetical protein
VIRCEVLSRAQDTQDREAVRATQKNLMRLNQQKEHLSLSGPRWRGLESATAG